MLMTEEEANGVWCPLSRDNNRFGGNRMGYGDAAAEKDAIPEYALDMAAQFPCIASSCMAWRWATPAESEVLLRPTDHVPDGYEPTGRISTAGREVWVKKAGSGRLGYCGAFGKPEV